MVDIPKPIIQLKYFSWLTTYNISFLYTLTIPICFVATLHYKSRRKELYTWVNLISYLYIKPFPYKEVHWLDTSQWCAYKFAYRTLTYSHLPENNNFFSKNKSQLPRRVWRSNIVEVTIAAPAQLNCEILPFLWPTLLYYTILGQNRSHDTIKYCPRFSFQIELTRPLAYKGDMRIGMVISS